MQHQREVEVLVSNNRKISWKVARALVHNKKEFYELM